MGGKNSKQRTKRNPVPAQPQQQRNDYRSFPAQPQQQPNPYSLIGDNYMTLQEVTDALVQAGLESSNLIIGIDFTKSNEWSGKISFNHRNLHDLEHSPNPYEQAISIIGRTLSGFDEDNLIPCFGFGDASTHDKSVFSFYPDNRPCNGFVEALDRYRELVPHVNLAGPTSFAPIIETAIGIVDESGGQYHVLLVIADGQVTRSVDTPDGHFSIQEKETVQAIVKASGFPLSIVVVGVGDGPWHTMERFDDYVPERAFDNFQFVNFMEVMRRSDSAPTREADFALAALMEIPSQYRATLDLQLLGKRKGVLRTNCLPPPPPRNHYEPPRNYANPTPADDQLCVCCASRRKNTAFLCGHQTCNICAEHLSRCPVCDLYIQRKIRLC